MAERWSTRVVNLRSDALYRGTSLKIKRLPVGPYIRAVPRVLGWSYGGGAVSYERSTPVSAPLTIMCGGERWTSRRLRRWLTGGSTRVVNLRSNDLYLPR